MLTSAPFKPAQGTAPKVNNSRTVTPNAHISDACENLRNFKHSGAHLLK